LSRYWSSVVHTLTPYVPGEQPKIANLIKLNTNENPYGPSPRVLEALRAEATEALRLYPDPNADRVKEAVADYYRVSTAQTRPLIRVYWQTFGDRFDRAAGRRDFSAGCGHRFWPLPASPEYHSPFLPANL